MHLSAHHQTLGLHRAGEALLVQELERQRLVAERLAESGASAGSGDGVADASQPRRGLRRLLSDRSRPLTRPAAPDPA